MRFLLPLLLCFAPLSALAIGADWPISDYPRFWLLGEGFGHLAAEISYFQTNSNYDLNGQTTRPPVEGTDQVGDLKLHGGFGFAPRLSLFGQVDFRGVLMTPSPSSTLINTRNVGFGDAFLGVRWLVWRSRATDRIYPTEWSPNTWMLVAEGSWNFPIYNAAGPGQPPLGDQSNDFSGIGRIAWYANDWLSLSGSLGFTYRTAGYSDSIPWNLRADLAFEENNHWRFWLDFESVERLQSTSLIALNPQQPDPFPDGSLQYKSYDPTQRTAGLGAGYLVSRQWEVDASPFATISGVNSAKGYGASLALVWRPYQVPEINYDEYRKQQIEKLQTERREYRKRNVVHFGFVATVVKVSRQGNYLKISYGEKDRIQVGDTFYVLPPDNLSGHARRPVASASVVHIDAHAAYLHVDEHFLKDVPIREGFETIRTYFDAE